MYRRLLDRVRRMKLKVVKPLRDLQRAASLRVTLCDQNPEVAQALAESFLDVDEVEVVVGSLFDTDCDALVSPANSFGDMSGGIDQKIDEFYAGQAQRVVMERIAEQFHGELPVGMASLFEMGTRRFPYLIASPTMRVPSRVPDTLNAYLSMRAALIAVLDFNRTHGDGRIASLAVPGLCTGVGGMAGENAAVQMKAAYDMVAREQWRKILHPVQAPFALGKNATPIHWKPTR